MTDLTVILIVVAIFAPLLGFLWWRKRRHRADLTASTCGHKPLGRWPMEWQHWWIGPDNKVWGNKSVGMPEHPRLHPRGFAIDFPQPTVEQGHVHYVTFNHGSLKGKKVMWMRFRLEAADGVQFFARNPSTAAAMLTLYFQREGDDWSAAGKMEAYRWYATFATLTPLAPGEYEITVSLDDDRWTATQSSSKANNPEGFRAAIDNACCVGFVLGGGDGYGHGAYATGPAVLVVTAGGIE